MDSASPARHSSQPRRRLSHWTGQRHQVIGNEEHVYIDYAREPLVSVRDEGPPELREDVWDAIRRLIGRGRYEEYRRCYDAFAISAKAVTFVVDPVREVSSPDGEEFQCAAAI